jgi:hypothetical protein
MQLVKLLFDRKVKPDFQAIKSRVSEILNEKVDSSPAEDAKAAFLLFYKEHTIDFKDKSVPAQTAFMVPEDGSENIDYGEYIQQSWSFPNASEVVTGANYNLGVCEFMASPLDPQKRLRLFHSALQAAVETCDPLALVFHHSHQIVDPKDYLDSCVDAPELRPGSINIRFYNISNSDGDMIMDSRGLEEIGLPDLQCHFKQLEPNDVARVLFNTAVYLVEEGDVIESGQTIAGRSPEEKWLCQFEDSLLEPKRQLIGVNPGGHYAAGERNT